MRRGITGYSKSRKFQLARIAKGLCPMCAEPLPEGCVARCPSCTMRAREYAQAKYGHKPWVPGSRGRPPKYEYEEESHVEG
jgi:hypothetical protein